MTTRNIPLGDDAPERLALLRAIKLLGGNKSEVARVCGCTQANIFQIVEYRRRLPAEFVLPLEARTGVSRHELRPDIYPLEPAVSRATDITA
ncbi:YdaS family helix-turn-helix protein [Sphingomonas naphthae]|uniref:YdaS family helix-turn-helix protein n=1 Tax=Sphingomonas naphthae TaxID=1813468 RepID=A0ABY7TP46_9SPHN|nr:YdaS family helix-turn-helix protein [Sphingomonas naphthae]WCT75018.1 YdaS family helix-turn-helix protein [Sphingomonas naphthae]